MHIDLHNHSNHSDGVYSVSELVCHAAIRNTDVFALTDHDSVFGCDEIYEFAKTKNIFIIKGMELSTEHNNESVHIVCLFKKNIVPKEMIQFSIDNLNNRRIRAINMMNKIKDIYGLKIDIDKLIADNEVITRASMMRNIMLMNNLKPEEASFYVSSKSKAYIQSTKLSVKDGLELAKKAGCITILAHPCLLSEKTFLEIVASGFDGIEARYPSKKNDEKYFTSYAKKYNLFISAGSDCHGDNSHADINTCSLNYIEFIPIIKKLQLEEDFKRWKLNRPNLLHQQ